VQNPFNFNTKNWRIQNQVYVYRVKTIFILLLLSHIYLLLCGPGSSVGIATGYGLDGPRIEFRWGRDFLHLSRLALGPPNILYNGYRLFSEIESGRGVTLTPHSLLVSRSKNRVELHLYSP
jgi:hypothetical protein